MNEARFGWLLVLSLGLLSIGGASCSDESSEPASSGGDGGSHGDGSVGGGATAPDTLDAFCQTLAAFFCDRCPLAAGCPSDLATACLTHANARDPGGYTKTKGQACLDALTAVDCATPPVNCQGELAVAECNAYLAGQTDGVDPACP